MGVHAREEVVVGRRAGGTGLGPLLAVTGADSSDAAQPVHPVLPDLDAVLVSEFVGEEPVAEGGVISVQVVQLVHQVRVVVVTPADRVLEPLVVPLGRQSQDPARHRDRHPDPGADRGHLLDEREDYFPGRFAWDRYAAARRRTSFSCSNSRIRF
ncbi:hypothetical protein HF852_11810, partial [Corynebacterium xerosis]|nr:hypothetical protein [Corynebacterium xerosis]